MRYRRLWLPLSGGLAGLLAFKISAPFEASLAGRQFSLTDPSTLYTVGTVWGEVNRIAFGALIGAFFCFGLTAGRQPLLQVLRATLLGTFLGAVINFITDSSADLIGIAITKSVPKEAGMVGNLVSGFAWCLLVPMGIALVVLLALGPTAERVRRARYATIAAAVASYLAQSVGSLVGGAATVKQIADSALGSMTGKGPGISMATFIPLWRAQEIAVGIALGLVMVMADSVVRAGSLRLQLGRNEFREWTLDHAVNRVGSQEGVEIPIWGFNDVAPVHVTVVRQGDRFVLQPNGPPTLLNGQPVQPAELFSGDVILAGSAILIFQSKGYAPRSMPVMPVVPVASVQPEVAHEPVLWGPKGPLVLENRCYTIGRDQSNVICLDFDPSVSRNHAELRVIPGEVQVIDLGSKNGTRVNGQPVVAPIALREGDTIEFGQVRFTYGAHG